MGKLSEETKRKIGKANSKRMREFMVKHPDVTKERIKQMHAAKTDATEARRLQATRDAYDAMSDDDRAKFSENAKRLWADGTLREAHEKATQTFLRRSASGEFDFSERNENLSKAITKKYQEGGFQWSRGHYEPVKGLRPIYYRSSWELKLAQMLDADPHVRCWEYEFTVLIYELDGKSKRYLPDFHVTYNDGTEKLVEVKPTSLRGVKMNEAKRLAAKKFCESKKWTYEEYAVE